ncbi:MAG: hypothetical protein FWB77_03275 [Treponema sp.]|nr:hypothetical protein [Treponema sp.]
MKKVSLFIVLFLAVLSLFGQNFREAKIHVPPIDGAGRAEDNVYFYKQLTYEVILQYHTVVRSRNGSDFILKGTIEPLNGIEFDISYPEDETPVENVPVHSFGPVPPRPIPPVKTSMNIREFFSWEVDNGIHFFDASGEDNYVPGSVPLLPPAAQPEVAAAPVPDGEEYIFKLELINSRTAEVLSGQSIIYYNPDASVNELISIIVYNMLSGIPDEVEPEGDWRDKWFFFDICALWAPRYDGKDSINFLNFGVKMGAELHFTSFMSLGIGLQLMQEFVVLETLPGEEFRDILIELPVSMKFVFKLSDYFLLEPYGGVSFNFSIMGVTVPSTMSWFAGVQFGVKAGPGAIVINPRFAMDFYKSMLSGRPNEYTRICMQLGIGYKFGVYQKVTRIREY